MRNKSLIVCFGILLFAAAAFAVPEFRSWLSAAHAQDAEKPAAKRASIGKNVAIEVEGDKRRVIVEAEVCLRQGQLEQLLTRKRTKEHEAVLVADIDARDLHKALVIANAEAGHPVIFQPKFKPPTGSTIKVTLEYQEKGKTVRKPAQEFIRSFKTKKTLDTDWVFTGSRFFKDPTDPNSEPYYLANDGDVICIANFDTALMDVPFDSSKDNDHLTFEANTEAIPPLQTPVRLILEVAPAKKK
jgi:hypothetical protein